MTREEMHTTLNPEADLFKAELIDMMYYSQTGNDCTNCKHKPKKEQNHNIDCLYCSRYYSDNFTPSKD